MKPHYRTPTVDFLAVTLATFIINLVVTRLITFAATGFGHPLPFWPVFAVVVVFVWAARQLKK